MIGDTEANKRNKFEWKLNIIRLEKIISAPMLPPKFFLEVSALPAVRHCPKLQSWAISGKTNDGILRKKQKSYHNFESNLDPTDLFQGFYLDNIPTYHPMYIPGKLLS